MSENLALFKCGTCKKVVQVLVEGKGELVCCGKSMNLLSTNTEENVKEEYHLPVIFNSNDAEYIQVGKELHPNSEEHHIEFIQIISECGKKIFTHIIGPSFEPKIKIEFENFGNYSMKELCNIHGLWENKK